MGHGIIKIGKNPFSASQVATFFGAGYKTEYQLWEQYKGIAKEDDFSEEAKKSMEFGTFFEEPVARWYAKQFGVRLKRCGEMAYWADDMPYFTCHPDRLTIGKDKEGRRVAVEIKCVKPYADGWGEEGTAEIPDNYYFQVQSYYACQVPCDLVRVACMKGNRVYFYDVPREDDVVNAIREKVRTAKEQWDHGIVPERTYIEARDIYKDKVNLTAEGIGANDSIVGLYDIACAVHKQLKSLKDQEEKIKAAFTEALGSNSCFTATTQDKKGKPKIKKLVYWSHNFTNNFDTDQLHKDHPEIDLSKYKTSTENKFIVVNYPRV